MPYQSPALIEYVVGATAYELSAVGGWLVDPFRLQGEQDLYESDGFNAADGWFQPLGGAIVAITFSTEEEFATHVEAQAAFSDSDVFDGDSLLAATGTLRVTIGATINEWGNAVLQRVIPTLPSGPTSTVVRSFVFTAPAVSTS